MKRVSFSELRIVALGLLLGQMACGCVGRLPSTVRVQRDIPYAQVDGRTLKLDIYSPKQATNPVPALVWLHPGAWDMGSKSFCPIGFMAATNLAIVSVDYRLSEVAPFPAQLYDCKGAVRWLRANAEQYHLDPDHIGVFGASAGGHLALLLADTAGRPGLEGDIGGNRDFSSRVQCACAFYPPTDLNRLVRDPKDRLDPDGDVAKLLGGPLASNVDKAIAASPLTYVDKDCAPVFLMHGTADQLVPVEQSRIFYDALVKADVAAELEIVPKKGHGIIAPPPVAEKAYRFFDRYLQAGR